MDGLSQMIENQTTPLLLIDEDQVRKNCKQMIEKCKRIGVNLRPHMKTHKTIEGGILMTDGTKKCITVSTIKEAEFYADGGFDDILYAALFTKDKIKRLDRLSTRLNDFHVLVDSKVCVQYLIDQPRSDNKPWSVFMKLNCGYNRAGALWDSDNAMDLAGLLHSSPGITFKGIYTHDGNAYDQKSPQGVTEAGNDTANKLLTFKKKLNTKGYKCDVVATGSTPSCSLSGETMAKLDEFHPGNYIFYDCDQLILGSCDKDLISIRVATRIVGHYPERNEVLIDCGWTALSQDGHGALNGGSYCYIEGHPKLSLYKMTQEVGTIKEIEGKPLNYEELPIGKILYLLPHHSCATAGMHQEYLVHNKKGIAAKWKPCQGW